MAESSTSTIPESQEIEKSGGSTTLTPPATTSVDPQNSKKTGNAAPVNPKAGEGDISAREFSKIRKLNIAAFFLFASVAALFGYLVGSNYRPEVKGIPTDTYVIRRTVSIDPKTQNGQVLGEARKVADHTPWLLFGLVVAFMVLTSAGHLLVSTFFRKTYEEDLSERGYNRFRWIEYSITSAIMLVVLAFSLGCQELWALVALVVTNVVMMYCGFVAECNLAPGSVNVRRALLAWGMGTLLFVFIWAYLGVGFDNALSDLKNIREQFGENNGQLPDSFFWALFLGLFFLYFSFGAVQAVHLFKTNNVYSNMKKRIDSAKKKKYEPVLNLKKQVNVPGANCRQIIKNFQRKFQSNNDSNITQNKIYTSLEEITITNNYDCKKLVNEIVEEELLRIEKEDEELLRIEKEEENTADSRSKRIRRGVEVGYITLSFVSKTLLSSLLIWGLSGRNQASAKRKDDDKNSVYPKLIQ